MTEKLCRVDAHLSLALLCQALLCDFAWQVVGQVVDDKGDPGHDVLIDLLGFVFRRGLEVLVQLDLIVCLVLHCRFDHLHAVSMCDASFMGILLGGGKSKAYFVEMSLMMLFMLSSWDPRFNDFPLIESPDSLHSAIS